MKHLILILAVFLIGPKGLQAKVFKNSYIKFEMPDTWSCDLERKAYLCRHKISGSCQKDPKNPVCAKEIHKSREALIVMAAKEKSEIDNYDNYLAHFGKPKVLILKNGNSAQSKVVHAKAVNVQKSKWIDAMHLSSELPNYYTRYLARISGDIGVLVTFTAHKKYYTQYSNQFFKSIKSLNVTASQLKGVAKKEIAPPVLSHPIDIPDELFNSQEVIEPQPSSGVSGLLFGLAMLLAGIGIYIWIRSRK